MSGDDLLNHMRHLARPVFGFDLDEHPRAADRRLFGFLRDSRTGRLTRLFGEPGEEVLALLNHPILDVGKAAAGYQSAVRSRLAPLLPRLDPRSRAFLASLETDFDFFFVADDVLREEDDFVKAITFHEECHLVEQGGLRSLPFTVNAGDGRALYDSLPDPAFRQNHTPEFCDLLARAARRVCEIGEPFADDLDVVAKAMHYEYEGDDPSAREVMWAAMEHHARNGNRPAFFEGGYLPKIDAMYRNQVKITRNFVVSPGEAGIVQAQHRRPLYVLSEPAYRQVFEQAVNLPLAPAQDPSAPARPDPKEASR